MSGHDARFVRDAELRQHLLRLTHCLEIGPAAHDDAHEGLRVGHMADISSRKGLGGRVGSASEKSGPETGVESPVMKRAILFLALTLTTPVMAQNAAPIQLDYTQF